MAEINYIQLLQSMFPNRSDDQLRNIVAIVLEASPSISFDETFESMVNLLSEDGAQGPMPDLATADPQRTERVEDENISFYEGLYENLDEGLDEGLFEGLYEDLIEDLYEDSYRGLLELRISCDKKDKLDPCTVWKQLKSALPEADPEYLKKEANRLARLPESNIDDFVLDAIENNQYPTRNDKCTICYERMQTRMPLECGHTFHRNCIDTWLRTAEYKTCPICRTPTALT